MAKTVDNKENNPAENIQERLQKENEYVIKNKRVRRQSRRRTAVIILTLFLSVIAILAGVVYAIMQFVDDSQFRISVSQTGTSWLTLSKDYDFTNPTSVLDVSAPKTMDNCTLCNYLDVMLEDIYQSKGSYKAEESDELFVATSFYLKNSGEKAISYRESITLDRAMKGMEKALRILVIKDIEPPDDDQYGDLVVYAAPKCDQNGKTIVDEEGNPVREEVVPPGNGMTAYTPKRIAAYDKFNISSEDLDENGVWYTQPFLGNGYVVNSELFPLEPGQIIKYSVVIWLEGQDEQCIDAILGGQVKLAVEFTTGSEK